MVQKKRRSLIAKTLILVFWFSFATVALVNYDYTLGILYIPFHYFGKLSEAGQGFVGFMGVVFLVVLGFIAYQHYFSDQDEETK